MIYALRPKAGHRRVVAQLRTREIARSPRGQVPKKNNSDFAISLMRGGQREGLKALATFASATQLLHAHVGALWHRARGTEGLLLQFNERTPSADLDRVAKAAADVLLPVGHSSGHPSC